MPGSIWTPIDDATQLKDVRLRLLLAHWRDAFRLGMMPSKDFIDPGRLGDLMGWLFLYRVERDQLRFFYLLYGPKIARRIGFDLTGKYVDDHLDPEARVAINRLLAAVVTTGRPHRGEAPRRLLDQAMTTEAVVLPLVGPDGVIDHLLALQILDVSADA